MRTLRPDGYGFMSMIEKRPVNRHHIPVSTTSCCSLWLCADAITASDLHALFLVSLSEGGGNQLM